MYGSIEVELVADKAALRRTAPQQHWQAEARERRRGSRSAQKQILSHQVLVSEGRHCSRRGRWMWLELNTADPSPVEKTRTANRDVHDCAGSIYRDRTLL